MTTVNEKMVDRLSTLISSIPDTEETILMKRGFEQRLFACVDKNNPFGLTFLNTDVENYLKRRNHGTS